MKPEVMFMVWAPESSPWSPWASPVVFPALRITSATETLRTDDISVDSFRDQPFGKTVVILDLPGSESVSTGMALVQEGYRPVPLFCGFPGPASPGENLASAVPMGSQPAQVPMDSGRGSDICTVDMSALVLALQAATVTLAQSVIAPDAPPVFLLDSSRIEGHHAPIPSRFDNRWMIFPQDFPSAMFLRSKGFDRALLARKGTLDPVTDLRHVLRRWQEAGIEIWAVDLSAGDGARKIDVPRPSNFKSVWHRALAILGLRRSSAGGFGSYIPEPSSSGRGFG